MTNGERIIAALRNSPGLDDDELSSMTGIRPRQQVNQICRRLEAGGVVFRGKSADGKIVNVLVDGAPHTGERASVKAPSHRAVSTCPGSFFIGAGLCDR